MKKQIKRFSPHQTAKVFAILTAIGSLPMFLPIFAMSVFTMPTVDPFGNPLGFPWMMFAGFPVMYLFFSYLSIVIGCWLYNFMFALIGGIEYETTEE